jgi:SET domain-containing protein
LAFDTLNLKNMKDSRSSHPTAKNENEASSAEAAPQKSLEAGNGSTIFRVDTGSKGRGLFASHDIAPGSLIHEAPCLRVVKEEYDKFMRFTILEHYLFNTDKGDKLLALGCGSLFNHSRHPNVDYRLDSTNLCIRYICGHKIIRKDEELCISYGGNLWFNDTSEGEHESSESDDDTTDGMANFLNRLEL